MSDTGKPNSELCFFVNVDINIIRNNSTLLQESLGMTKTGQTAGLPPTQCASIDRWIEDDGQLIQDSARVYIEVLAVEIRNRVKNLKP